MGSKCAVVHLRTDEPETALCALREKFGHKEEELAEIVVRQGFVSVYWYDHIRVDNVERETKKFAKLCGMPALGVSLFDDDMLSFFAVSCAGMENEEHCRGFYYFLEGDVVPADAVKLCRILEIEPMVFMFSRLFECDDIDEMVEILEEDIGLPVFFEEEEAVLDRWEAATVFEGRKK